MCIGTNLIFSGMGGCCSALCCMAQCETDDESLHAAVIASAGTLCGRQSLQVIVQSQQMAILLSLVILPAAYMQTTAAFCRMACQATPSAVPTDPEHESISQGAAVQDWTSGEDFKPSAASKEHAVALCRGRPRGHATASH